MSVDLHPPELGFRRPFTHEVSQVLRLHNPNSEPVAFKVKTTAPKQYCVRPNSGRIEPNSDVEVQVLLQAMKEDPPADARCRDKFLVQSVAIGAAAAESSANVAQIWSNIEQTAKSSIQEKKIRVSFLPADGSTPAANGLAASHHEDESPPSYSSPAPPALGALSTPQKQTTDSSARSPEAPSTAKSTLVNTVANVTGYSQKELEQQLEEAKATISRLQQQATDGLRQRKTGVSGSTDTAKGSPASLQTGSPPGGVSVQIVALLCFLSFLIAYLFF
ncbi:msp domain-containing protein [Zymoseptoria brevis]|uniref:Msp domain-containing protein n=1 Tax=Zymoseptoria brevis TaxID=1047168 RepID=A0A0F4GIH7_9PEZI|nr:msp domain-containing protein [Zymoseptoria brevis]